MRIRRCTPLLIEPQEVVAFALESLLAGGGGIGRKRRWVAFTAQRADEVEIDSVELELLGKLSPSDWTGCESLSEQEYACLSHLLESGLITAEVDHRGAQNLQRGSDRATWWWPIAAVLHRSGRWHGVETVKSMEEGGLATAGDLRMTLGAPPPAVAERTGAERRVPLPRSGIDDFEKLLIRRATCRNFDTQPLSQPLFAQMLQRVFSAQAQVRVSEDTVFLKKTSPSGGGLHATEAYLIVQNVEDIAPGLYHYHPVDHALEPLPPPKLPLAKFARLALAGQYWFANAPVLVALTPRFARSFWKYRYHAKAYRALILDSGHLSQTLYLSATELGLGAFVTSAINEIDIEEAFGLDPLEESPLAICGFGWRAERMETAEFDPAGEVWEHGEPG